jgi:choline transport protein
MTAAVVITWLGVLLAFFVLNAICQTASRVTWSFARDNGLLFSRFLERIHPTLEAPVCAIMLNWFILVVFGCIFMASQTGEWLRLHLRISQNPGVGVSG